MDKFDQKYKKFLESLYDHDPKLMGTIIKGFEITRKVPEVNNNPYALIDRFDLPEQYYDNTAYNDKVEIVLTPKEEELVNDVCKRFNIKPSEIKDDYLLYHQDLAPFQYLDRIENLTEWKTKAYYDNEKDEYYGVVKRGYETPLDNKYGNSGISSGGH